MLDGPNALGEPVVLLVFLIAIEMEDALNEVLGEHDWILLQQEMHQAELPKAGKEEKNDLIIRQLLKATPETQAVKHEDGFPLPSLPQYHV